MSLQESGPMTRVRELQHAFDRTFAEPPRSDAALRDDFLAMTIGGDPYAMRLSEVAGLYLTRKMTGLPGAVPALLGVVGLRGGVLPAYDLGSLLGYPKAAHPRWLAITVDGQVAVGFEQFDGHLRVARDIIAEAAPGHAASQRPLVRESLHTETVVRPIIHLPSVLQAIAVMMRHAARPKE
jgi:chemotaxis signal transduction protein